MPTTQPNQPISSSKEILKSLTEPLNDNEIQWKVQTVFNNNGLQALVVPYVQSRAIMERLDNALGLDWYDSFRLIETIEGNVRKVSVECTIYIYDHTKGQYVGRTDVGELTQVSDVKGGYSDAFKRAAVKWGVGRILYSLPKQYVPIHEHRPKNVPYEDVEYINSRYKVNGQQQYVKGYYIRPKLSQLVQKPAPSPQNQGTNQRTQPQNQGTNQRTQTSNPNQNGPTPIELQKSIKLNAELLQALGVQLEHFPQTFNLCGLRAYKNLNELTNEEHQILFNKMNPIRLLLDNSRQMGAPFELLLNVCSNHFGAKIDRWTDLVGKITNVEVKQLLEMLKARMAQQSMSNLA